MRRILKIALILYGALQAQNEPIRQKIEGEQAVLCERLGQYRESLARLPETVIEDACCARLRVDERVYQINQDIDRMLSQSLVTEIGVNSIQARIDLLKRELNSVQKIGTQFRRIEKRLEEVKSLIQYLEGDDFQKMELVMNRVMFLLQQAGKKRDACEMVAAAKIIYEIENIGRKIRGELRQKFTDANRLEKYIERNGDILEMAESRLEKRIEHVGYLIKDSQDEKVRRAYENACRRFETAKILASRGKDDEALKEFRLAINLLGKAVHTSVKNDPKVAREVEGELKRVREKVHQNLQRVKASDNPEVKAAAKDALKHISQAKVLITNQHYKLALAHLFKAVNLSEKAVNIMLNLSNPELEEDTDIEELGDEG